MPGVKAEREGASSPAKVDSILQPLGGGVTAELSSVESVVESPSRMNGAVTLGSGATPNPSLSSAGFYTTPWDLTRYLSQRLISFCFLTFPG
jgi:hypothetical protein